MRLITLSTLIATTVLSSACANFAAVASFKRAPVSGVEGSKVALYFPGSPAAVGTDNRDPGLDLGTLDPDVKTVLATNCPEDPGVLGPAIAGAAIPIVAALAQAGFNLWMDQQQRTIDAIVKSATSTSAITLPLSPKDLKAAKCVAFVRYTQEDGQPRKLGTVAVLKVTDLGKTAGGSSSTFKLRPIYVRMADAAAVTADAAEPKATVSIAVSVKAVGTPEGGVQRLLPAGEGTLTVRGVSVGPSFAPRCRASACTDSDLIPYPEDRGVLSFTVSLTEQGVTGFDDVAANAELVALKAALGPAIGEAVSKKLGN